MSPNMFFNVKRASNKLGLMKKNGTAEMHFPLQIADLKKIAVVRLQKTHRANAHPKQKRREFRISISQIRISRSSQITAVVRQFFFGLCSYLRRSRGHYVLLLRGWLRWPRPSSQTDFRSVRTMVHLLFLLVQT